MTPPMPPLTIPVDPDEAADGDEPTDTEDAQENQSDA